MSLFRSLNQSALRSAEINPQIGDLAWPATIATPLPAQSISNIPLLLRFHPQPVKPMTVRQLMTLPNTLETKTFYSKAGWMAEAAFRGIPFQTLLNLLSANDTSQWVKIETHTDETYLLHRDALRDHRLIFEQNAQPVSILYGGPFMLMSFDEYLEFAISHVKQITLMEAVGNNSSSDETAESSDPRRHAATKRGLSLEDSRVQPDNYYHMNQDQILNISNPGAT